MFSLPEPLHPALVHFPIVLLLVGTVLAWVAAFYRQGLLPWITAAFLSLGAIGAVLSVETGERDQELLGELAPEMEQTLDQHEDWGEITRNVAIASAALSILAAFAWKNRSAVRALALLSALSASASAYCVYQTGHLGGKLVYQFGAGVKVQQGGPANGAVNSSHEHKEKDHPKNRDHH